MKINVTADLSDAAGGSYIIIAGNVNHKYMRDIIYGYKV